jgi:hypothetical protein
MTTPKATIRHGREVYVEMWAGNVVKLGHIWKATPSDQDYEPRPFETRAAAVAYLLTTMKGDR